MKSVPVQATGALEDGRLKGVLFEPAAAHARVPEVAVALRKRSHDNIIPRFAGL